MWARRCQSSLAVPVGALIIPEVYINNRFPFASLAVLVLGEFPALTPAVSNELNTFMARSQRKSVCAVP
jgi:hypothetical protein